MRTSDRFVTYGRLTEDETHEAVLTREEHDQARASALAAHTLRIRRYLENPPGPKPKKPCPDCGGVRPKNKSRCYECAETQARMRARDRQRKHRRGGQADIPRG